VASIVAVEAAAPAGRRPPIATGVYPDMTEHGWPQIFERVVAADILVLLSPGWRGA
jgi:hypothetical protein